MPAAPPYNPSDPQELPRIADYAKTHLAAGLGQDIQVGEHGLDMGQQRLCMAPAASVEGMLTLYVSAETGMPFGTQGSPDFVVLFEAVECLALVVPTNTWANILSNPAASGGMVKIENADGGWRKVSFPLMWAQTTLGNPVRLGRGKGSFIAQRAVELAESDQFVHLHNHSVFSLLDGASTIEGMVHRARANGQGALALTDHGYCFGTYKFYEECRRQGIKPIVGVEAYVVDDASQRYIDTEGRQRRFEYHQTILCQNQTGWANLCALLSKAGRDHYYYAPRVDHQMLFDHSEGLIVLSGCFKGMAAWHLQDHSFQRPRVDDKGEITDEMETVDPSVDRPWMRRDPDESRRIVRRYREVFGDRYYGEVMNIDFDRYNAVVPELLQIFADEGVPPVATVDCHYEVAEDASTQAMAVSIATDKVDQLGKSIHVDRGVYYIRERADVEHSLFEPAFMERSCEIAARCEVDLDFTGYLFPEYDMQADADWAAYQGAKSA